MNYRQICILVAIVAVTAAVTRHYFPSIQIKTVETVKEVVKTDVQTVVRVIKQPNGAEETVTTITDHSVKSSSETKTAIKAGKGLSVSALVANDFSNRGLSPIYGASVSKEIIGPITIGAFGLTNGTVGVSVGLNF